MSNAPEYEPNRPSIRIRDVVVVILVIGFLLSLLLPGIEQSRENARCATCIGDLGFVGSAMSSFCDANGRFPAAYPCRGGVGPPFSWRLLLTPFLGERATYERYCFDEAWNSPHNRSLATGVPTAMSPTCPIYHCPSDVASDLQNTSRVMVVGKEAFSEGPKGRNPKEIADGLSHTIAVVEMSESDIHWMEPRDIVFDTMSLKIDDPAGSCIRSKHLEVANVLFCDSSVHCLKKDIDPAILRSVLTIAGGEPFPSDEALRPMR
jgi:hypothetical protein